MNFIMLELKLDNLYLNSTDLISNIKYKQNLRVTT
jgi:hypothetical protein